MSATSNHAAEQAVDLTLIIDGMSCQACASRIEKVLAKKDAIISAEVNYANEVAHIRYHGTQAHPAQIIQWIDKAGFQAHVQQTEEIFAVQNNDDKPPISLLLVWLCLLPFLVGMVGMMLGSHAFMPPLWLQFVLASVVQFGLALPFYKSAWASIRGGLANMDVLVVLGTLTIWAYSTYIWLSVDSHHHVMPEVYFEASVMVIAFIKLGKYLELRTKKHSLNSINLLLNLIPNQVAVRDNQGQWHSLPLDLVNQGDILLAKAGTRIAADGVVMVGEGWCDESHLTGESELFVKTAGDSVLAGAMVENGSFEYQVLAKGSQTRLGDMIQALSDAQGSKANIARLADKVSGIFVPTVVAIALATLVVNYGLLGEFDTALMRAVAVLVIACPCALGLATPAAIMAGMGVAARSGVWFLNAEALELAGSVDTVVLDKTGTITEGRPKLVAQYYANELLDEAHLDQPRLWALIAAVEQQVSHPLAATLVAYANTNYPEQSLVHPYHLSQIDVVRGQGVQAQVDGLGLIKIGTPTFANFVLPDELDASLWRIASQVAVSLNDKPVAALALADALKPDSIKAISSLQQKGLEVVIMSGDKTDVVQYVAKQVQVTTAYGELLPRDKAEKIKALQAAGHKVAMVGDGINDAAAMAVARASFAVQNASDIAKHSATARLMGESIHYVDDAVAIARATLSNIKQNLFFAFVYNCIGIVLAAMGLLNPMVAAAAMALSSISVLLNALRLTRFVPK